MPLTPLFVLAYTRRNATRSVSYQNENGVRSIVNEEAAFDPDEPQGTIGTAAPDAWPYADQALITTVMEGALAVRIYATRVSPFARFETSQVAGVCDIQLSNYFALYNFQTQRSNIGFAISTSNGPFETSLDGGPYTRDQTSYLDLPNGAHTLDARDALSGCRIPTFAFTLSAPPPTGEDPDPSSYPLPAGAIVLRIRDKQVLNDDRTTTHEYTTYYYLPSTRSVGSMFTGTGTDDRSYLRPRTEIIDRWCVEAGVAPFTEIQVTHDGIGGVTRTPVDGALACMIRCTLGLSATGLMQNGLGTLTASSSGAQGRVLMSLDNFATPGVEEVNGQVVFENLPEGSYTVSARDNAGCLATANVQLASAYAIRYRLRYDTIEGTLAELRLLERDYEGEIEEVCGGGSPVEISVPGTSTGHVYTDLVRGSALDMTLLVEYAGQYTPVFSGDERLFRVEHDYDGQLDWRGYLLPEQYSVPFLAPPQYFSLSATDGLGTLSTIPFLLPSGARPVGDWSLLDVLLLIFAKLGLDLPFRVRSLLYPAGADRTRSYLETVSVDVAAYYENNKPWDCGRVLRAVLETPLVRFYQEEGALWLERIADLRTDEMEYFAYSATGVPAPLVRVTKWRPIEPDSALKWLLAQQVQGIRGAVAEVVVASEVGEIINQFERLLPADTATRLPNWSGEAPYQLVYKGKGKTPWLRLFGAAPGVPLLATQWVQTPPTQPFPFPADFTASLRLTVKGQAYGQVIPDPAAPLATRTAQTAMVGLGFKWGSLFDFTPTTYRLEFPTTGVTEFTYSFASPFDSIGGPVSLRISQPIAGAALAPVTVDIQEISLRWEVNDALLADSDPREYFTQTGLRVSRVDQTSLFHLDTPLARKQGTLLAVATQQPTATWQQTAGGPALQIGAWHVLTRASWQDRPAQTLSGTLKGRLLPGALLSDADEQRPCVYLLTDYRRQVKQDECALSAVEVLPLVAPNQTLLEGMLYEDTTAVLDESGEYLLYEPRR